MMNRYYSYMESGVDPLLMLEVCKEHSVASKRKEKEIKDFEDFLNAKAPPTPNRERAKLWLSGAMNVILFERQYRGILEAKFKEVFGEYQEPIKKNKFLRQLAKTNRRKIQQKSLENKQQA